MNDVEPREPPDVVVVVPTFRRPDLLGRCLAALCAQTLARDRYEICIADDDPTGAGAAETRALVASHHAITGGAPTLHYVPVTRTQGPAGARNAGWQRSTARVVAFTDDDTIPDPTWLERGLAYLATGYDAAGGTITMPLPAVPTDYERDASGLARAAFATANCFVTRDALVATGGFDERFGAAWREDSDLHFTLLSKGFRVGFASDAVVVHPVRPAPFGVSIGQQRKVVFDALLYRKHPRLYRSLVLPSPPWNYYAGVGALALAVLASRAAPRFAALAFAGWVAVTLGFVRTRLRGTSRRARHVAEMVWTSIVIPPLALWWRLVGSLRFRVVFL